MAVIGVPPAITEENEFFWEGTARGELLVEQCPECATFVYPARGICSMCRHRPLDHVALVGPGVIYSFTVNHKAWSPDMEVPYGLAEIEFPSFPGVVVLGRLRDFDLESVAIGDLVDVGVEEGPGGFMVPSFVPWAPTGTGE